RADAAIGATTISTSVTLANGTYTLGPLGSGAETITVSGASGTSAPFTITVAALTKVHKVGEIVASDNELARQQINQWLRERPYGVAGILDWDKATADRIDPTKQDAEWAGSDNVHMQA